MPSRTEKYASMRNAAATHATAAALLTIVISSNFCLMEWDFMNSFFQRLRQRQQLGTDGQSGLHRRRVVDLEADFLLFHHKIDGEPRIRKMRHVFRYRQDVRAAQRAKDFGRVFLCRNAHEQNVTSFGP